MTQSAQPVVSTAPTAGVAVPEIAGRVRKGRFRREWRNPIGLIGAAIVLVTVLLAVLAPVVSPYLYSAQGFGRLAPPSASHWMGTDELGRDQLSRIIYGARV